MLETCGVIAGTRTVLEDCEGARGAGRAGQTRPRGHLTSLKSGTSRKKPFMNSRVVPCGAAFPAHCLHKPGHLDVCFSNLGTGGQFSVRFPLLERVAGRMLATYTRLLHEKPLSPMDGHTGRGEAGERVNEYRHRAMKLQLRFQAHACMNFCKRRCKGGSSRACARNRLCKRMHVNKRWQGACCRAPARGCSSDMHV